MGGTEENRRDERNMRGSPWRAAPGVNRHGKGTNSEMNRTRETTMKIQNLTSSVTVAVLAAIVLACAPQEAEAQFGVQGFMRALENRDNGNGGDADDIARQMRGNSVNTGHGVEAKPRFGVRELVEALENRDTGNSSNSGNMMQRLVTNSGNSTPAVNARGQSENGNAGIGKAMQHIGPMVPGVSCAQDLIGRAKTTADDTRSGKLENAHWNATYTLGTAARCLGDLRLLGQIGRGLW